MKHTKTLTIFKKDDIIFSQMIIILDLWNNIMEYTAVTLIGLRFVFVRGVVKWM